MKETTLQRVQSLLETAVKRRDQLIKHINEYKESSQWEEAMKAHIAKRQFDIFIDKLEEIIVD